MPASTRQNRNTNFRPQSELAEVFELIRQMKLNILVCFFHFIFIISFYLRQSTNTDVNPYCPMLNINQEQSNLNSKRNESYSASELRYKPFSDSDRQRYMEIAKEMFYHGYNSYMLHAFPLDELNPLACTGRGPDTNNP